MVYEGLVKQTISEDLMGYMERFITIIGRLILG